MYRPINTMNTAGAIIPMRGTKTEGSQVAASSLDIGYPIFHRYLKECLNIEPIKSPLVT